MDRTTAVWRFTGATSAAARHILWLTEQAQIEPELRLEKIAQEVSRLLGSQEAEIVGVGLKETA